MSTPRRQSGILLHPTSLAGPEGLGTMGREALDYVDFLARAGQRLWQLLPLGPAGYGDSPYACFSSVAGNPLLISLADLRREGWWRADAAVTARGHGGTRVDYRQVERVKWPLLRQATTRFLSHADGAARDAFARFCTGQAGWLDDYALFMAIKDAREGQPWWRWPKPLRFREPRALEAARGRLAAGIAHHQVLQHLFARQWGAVRAHARARGVRLVGDMPIYVAHDSADVWACPRVFLLDRQRRPLRVAGVPPDYFSRTGQLWGNPVYDWRHLRRTDFAWWVQRVQANLALYDVIRFDHFRALAAYWGVPFGHRTAQRGRWYPAAGHALLSRLHKTFDGLEMIVEDLGMITPDVHALRDAFALPGMKILHYAFGGGGGSDYLPHHYPRNSVVYTGTHDNDTTMGWFRGAPAPVRRHACDYVGDALKQSAWPLVRAAWASVADIAIVPMQDLLDLGSRARMNVPGTTAGNWQWRMRPGDASPALAANLLRLTDACGRVAPR